MANKGPLTADERLRIVEALKRGTHSHRELAKRFNRSQSTISSIAKDAGIVPSRRRTRTPAAKDIEGSFGGHERSNLADIVLGVIRQTVAHGGLNPRELKDTTQALKLALEVRRAEDFPEVEDNKGAKPEEDKEEFVGVGLGELRIPKSLAEDVDGRLSKEREAMERGEAWAFPSYGITEHHPDWMREAYNRMLAKKRAESNGA